MRLWDRLRAQPVHVLCWAAFFGVLGWAASMSFPTGFDPNGADSNRRGSDFIYYYKGAEGVWNGTDPYARFTYGFRVDHAYNYPPMVAVVLSPLTPLGVTGAAQVWFVVNLVLVGGLFIAWYAVIARRFKLPTDLLSSGAVLALAMAVSVEVVRREIDDLQTDTVMLAALLVMTVCMDRKSWSGPAAAGLALAVGIHVKFLLLVFLPYLLLTRRLRTLGWAVGGTVAIFLLTALVSGWDENLRHYSIALGGAARILGVGMDETLLAGRVHDLTWHNSVSLPSAVARQLAGDATRSLEDPAPAYSRAAVHAVTVLLAAACAAIGWWIYRLRRVPLLAGYWTKEHAYDVETRARMALVEVSMGVAALLAFSPQTMKRHMFMALPIIVMASAFTLLRRKTVPAWPPLLALLVIAGGMILPPGDGAEHLVERWKWISGVSFCLLIGAFLTQWTALRTHIAIEAGEPVADPPPARVRWFKRRVSPAGG